MNFTYSVPTKVYFGNIDFNNLHAEIAKKGNNVLIVTGGSCTTLIANQIKAGLEEVDKSINIQLVDGITTNSPATYIDKVAASISSPDIILSVGGGSVHDSAKVLAVLCKHKGTVEQYTTDGEYSVPGITDSTLPIVTIPTISGTGAEVSPAALVRINNKKRIVFSPYLYPQATFINPQFASTTPKSLLVKTALDAFVQGIESYVSTLAQDFSMRFSLSAIERILRHLPMLDQPSNSPVVLEQCALASIESLYAVGQSTVGAVHAISDPLSGIFNIHHGEAVGLLLPYVIDINYSAATKQYDEIHNLIDSILQIKTDTIQSAIFAFYEKIGFNGFSVAATLINAGISSHIHQCVCDSFNGDMVGNPKELNNDQVYSILKKATELAI